MVAKVEKAFGAWDHCLPSSFVTSGEFKGFPEKTKEGGTFDKVEVKDKIKNSVNAYGAVSTLPISASEFIYTSGAEIVWVRGDEQRRFGGGERTFGDLSAHGDHVYAVQEDRSVRPSQQSIVRFTYNNMEAETIASGCDFYASPRIAGVPEHDLADAMWILGDDRYYAVNDRCVVYAANGSLYKKDLASGHLQQLDTDGFTQFTRLYVDSDDQIYCIASGPVRGDTLLKGKASVVDQASDPTALLEYGFGEYEELQFEVDDAQTGGSVVVSGFFYPPVNPHFVGPAGARPPVLLLAHGGPTARATPALDRKKAFYQSRGLALFDLNYRGSTGRGRAFRDALYGRFGEADVQDLCAAARFLARRGLVDPGRVFAAGGSAGGYLLLRALARQPRLFKAAACSYGFADVYALCSEDHKFEYAYNFHLIAPKEDHKTWAERNMSDKLDQLSTPLALFHGLSDPVVPFQQSVDIHRALEGRVRTTLRLFEGEGHGFRAKAVVEDVLDDTYAFFCHELGVEPATPQDLAKL